MTIKDKIQWLLNLHIWNTETSQRSYLELLLPLLEKLEKEAKL